MFIRIHLLILALLWSTYPSPVFCQPTEESRHVVDVYIAAKAHEYHSLERAAQDSFDDKHYAKGIYFADQGLELERKYPRINVDRTVLGRLKAECLIKLGSVDEALKLLDTGMKSMLYGDIVATDRAIELRVRRKEFDKALEDCELLKNTYDPAGNYALHKSAVYQAMGDRSKALTALQEAYDVCINNDSETSIVRQRFYDLNSKPVDHPYAPSRRTRGSF